LEQSEGVNMMHQRVKLWRFGSRREEEVREEWRSEPVSTRQRRCVMFGERGCSRLEQSARVHMDATESVDV
jgi:hypothetical protein